MKTRARVLVTALLAAVLAPALTALAPGSPAAATTYAGGCAITLKLSNPDPDAGEQIVVRGILLRARDGEPLVGTVRVLTKRAGGTYRPVRGARVRTDADGHYRIRVVLYATGERTLKVVGTPTHRPLTPGRAWFPITVN